MTPVTGDINRCPAAGKQQYHVLNPTFDGLLREMSTDWSDTTDSFFLHCGRRTFPVRVQHYFELSVIEYTRDNGNGVRTSGSSPGQSTIKVGLLNDADL